ncbi:tyrosine-type recombinase/integrase [Nonomuraea sp. NPDC059194]|uniref:tyrosine-type recombinase/integrase n=1 Tax=Nonomuraea sp. NPDC059194 TaxID=3346764 RepID=UPI003690673D
MTPDTRKATLLIEQGVHIRAMQEILGHTRVTTAERYTHVATAQMKDASGRMDSALWGYLQPKLQP